MKKTFLLLIVAAISLTAASQEKEVKTGWRFGGALPAISFDTDLGFQYGALFEMHNYGEGNSEYIDRTYTEVSRYTKGSGIYRFMFESFHIIKGVHFTSDLSYLPDLASHFYGFNGYESVFNKAWMDDSDPDGYRTRMFYRFQRDQFRFKNDFDGKLAGEYFRWSAGFAFQKFHVSPVNIKKFDKLPSVPGLFEQYQSFGIIPSDETKGGWVNTVKAGLIWDSRDNRFNSMKGLWTEAGFEFAPGFMGNDWSFTRFYLTHRQYFTIVKENLGFAYRLGYQSTIGGHTPFFYQSQLITSLLTGATSEGLGGASSLRGVMKNRVIGDGFFYGNLELRWKPVRFNLFNQPAYIGLNAFYDFGIITNNIGLPADLQSRVAATGQNFSDYFNPESEKLHQSAGISIMPVWHENFVIAVDIGKSFNEQDGGIGFSIGLNYLF